MGLDNYIQTAMRGILKKPILEVLSEIKITKILKQRNFVKNSENEFGKDAYYRFIKKSRYNWRNFDTKCCCIFCKE